MRVAETAYLRAVRDLFERVAQVVAPRAAPLKVYLAGGAAVHWHTGVRISFDVDAEFTERLLLDETVINYVDEAGELRQVYLDRNYNPMFSLLHQDYQVDAQPASWLSGGGIDVLVLAPVDLAVSKLSRWAEVDRADIAALAKAGLLRADELERRATEALQDAVGVGPLIRHNIREAVQLVRDLQA